MFGNWVSLPNPLRWLISFPIMSHPRTTRNWAVSRSLPRFPWPQWIARCQADMSGIINISDGVQEELIPLSANSQTKGQGYAGRPSGSENAVVYVDLHGFTNNLWLLFFSEMMIIRWILGGNNETNPRGPGFQTGCLKCWKATLAWQILMASFTIQHDMCIYIHIVSMYNRINNIYTHTYLCVYMRICIYIHTSGRGALRWSHLFLGLPRGYREMFFFRKGTLLRVIVLHVMYINIYIYIYKQYYSMYIYMHI